MSKDDLTDLVVGVNLNEFLTSVRVLLGRAESELIWCSGSSDFAPGGIAHEGWKKGPRRVIAELQLFQRLLGDDDPDYIEHLKKMFLEALRKEEADAEAQSGSDS